MDWKSLISSVAPWISGALGSPLAGLAVGAICDSLGVSEKSENAIKQALSGVTPERMLALKKADQEFQLKMQELGFNSLKELEALAVQDRDSARKREIEVKDNTPATLAYMIIGGFLIISAIQLIVLMGFGEVVKHMPQEAWLLIGNVSGYLAAEAKAAASYYFGSTSGSNAKNEMLANMVPLDKTNK